MVCLCEWMTCPARSKWWALFCGFEVPHNDRSQLPKGETCCGFMLTCQCQEVLNISSRGVARNGQNMWSELSFLGQIFSGLFDHSITAWGIRTTMASGSITSWEIDGETVETVSDFIFLGSKITADGDCSHEIKRRLFLERKITTNLDSMFKSRHITLPTKVCLVKAMAFPMVMYGCESWTVKKAECWRIDAFELWCWRRLLRVP